MTGEIGGRRNINNHLATMIKGAAKTITIVTSAEGISRKSDLLSRYLAKAKQKGVKIRIAAPIEPQNKEAKELSKIAEVKNIGLKARFAVIDRKEVLLMLMDDEKVHPSYDLAIWANTEFFAGVLENSFDSFIEKK